MTWQKTTTEDLGRYFGYPECCIKDFEDRLKRKEFATRKGHFVGTGFVPCPKCMDRPRGEVVEEIQARRKHPEPFPRCTMKPSHILEFLGWKFVGYDEDCKS